MRDVGGRRLGLKELLGMMVESEASDPRDKMYALLGMVEGTGDGGGGRLQMYPVEYGEGWSAAKVFARYTAVFCEEGPLDILDEVRQLDTASAERLPSWAKDFSMRPNRPCDACRSAIWDKKAFSASYEVPLKIRFSALEPLCLEVWGYKVGNVASVFPCGPDPRRGVTCCADFLGDIARRFGPGVGVEGLLKAFLCARLCAAADAESAIQKMVEAIVSEKRKAERDEEPEKLEEDRIMRYLDPGIEDTLHKASFKNCLFLTDNPFVAMGPKSVGEGDVVCVLGGGRTPFVLRLIEGTVDGYNLVGVCYVYGIMNGEWILKHRSVDVKRFRLW